MSPSTAEILRRTDALFNEVEKLEHITFPSGQDDGTSKVPKDNLSRAGAVLHNLNEYNVRNMCGEAIYGLGLQHYIQERVSDRRFSRNTISCKLDETGMKGISVGDQRVFHPSITLERNSKRFRAYGDCGCSLAQEGSLCPHTAALMLAWVRKPQEFEYQAEDEFEEANHLVIKSVKELVSIIEKSSSRTCDLEVLQRIYSKLNIWSEHVKNTRPADQRASQSFHPVREFSWTINYVSLAIMSVIESKYNLEAIDRYNSATVSTFGSVLERFAEKSVTTKKSIRQLKAKQAMFARRKKTSSSHTSRSWDGMVEEFAG